MIEFSDPVHFQSEEEREWFAQAMEETVLTPLSINKKKEIAGEMLKSQAFDRFMASKFATVKRYGAEGAEAMVGFFHQIFRLSAQGLISNYYLILIVVD